jgi:RNA polymerase sigma-70 factor, ECF subfamily
MSGPAEITVLLHRIRDGDRAAESILVPLVYDELHRMARVVFTGERPGHTLQATALISELYMRMIRNTPVDWQSRAHFYRSAARTIRRVLVDHARATNAQRRPPPGQRIEFDDVYVYSEDRAYQLVEIDEALCQLAKWDARQAEVVDLHHFGGFTFAEIARILRVAETTVKEDWRCAKAWLRANLTTRVTT